MPSAQMVRAAMVFNFLRFTDFPTGKLASNGAIRLCVDVEDDQQARALAELSGHRVGNHPLVVTNDGSNVSDCQVLFVDARRVWSPVATTQTLTIGSYPGFLQDHGMIELTVGPDGTQFDVNLAESRRAGFRFAPQMLRLARRVYE